MDPDNDIVVINFGIYIPGLFPTPVLILHSPKHLHSPNEQLTSLASFLDYAASKVLKNTGHGKPINIWATGFSIRTNRFTWSALAIITYMSLCSYHPFCVDNTTTLA